MVYEELKGGCAAECGGEWHQALWQMLVFEGSGFGLVASGLEADARVRSIKFCGWQHQAFRQMLEASGS